MLLLLLTFLTKVWWFNGEADPSPEAIRADLVALKEDGVGGIVFYDQVHSPEPAGAAAFSEEWWDQLKMTALTARELGLTFEMAASNGYVAGGPWITPELAMKKTVVADTLVHLGAPTQVSLPETPNRVITIAFRDSIEPVRVPLTVELTPRDTIIPLPSLPLRAISYTVTPRGKGSTGSMNIPGAPAERYFGAKYVEYPAIGVLEESADSVTWSVVTQLYPVENNIGHKSRRRTISFPAVTMPRLRLRLYDRPAEAPDFRPVSLSDVTLYTRDVIDNIEVASGLRTEVTYPHPLGGEFGAVKPDDIRIITSADTLPAGAWRILSLGYLPTGARTKHGRHNLTGYEADVMSAEAARTHYDHYFRVVVDSLRPLGVAPIGMAMDSHEGGVQNWTAGFEETLEEAGISVDRLAAALGGYIVGSRRATDRLLSDFRREIARAIADRFYATFDSLCRRDGVDFTCQAMLNICNDNILSRGRVSKPQGEFWAYQSDGNYDVLDAASAAHLYGRSIASAEAFTDTPYSMEWDELLPLAYLAYCRGINELVVCASQAQPYVDRQLPDSASAHPYVFHRFHPRRSTVRPFWATQARCTRMLRQGRPQVDLLVFLGDFLPAKTYAYRLPEVPAGYTFDVVSSQVLAERIAADATGRLLTPDSMSYSALVIPERAEISPRDSLVISRLEAQGARVLRPTAEEALGELLAGVIEPSLRLDADSKVQFCHRATDDTDIYFVYNHSDAEVSLPAETRSPHRPTTFYYPASDTWHPATDILTLPPRGAAFILCSTPPNFM